MTYHIEDDTLLGPNVFQARLKDQYQYSGPCKPLFAVLHGANTSTEKLIKQFNNVHTKESAHLIVEESGKVTQLSPFNLRTPHAGNSHWKGYHGLNGFSIGIYLIQSQTSAIEGVLDSLLPVLVEEYNLRDIVSHREISPGRVHCGYIDAAPYKKYTEYGNADCEGRFVVTSPLNLNVRGGPSEGFEVVDSLNPGDAVKVLRYQPPWNQWAFILYEKKTGHAVKQGWVHESFLRRL